MLVLSRIVTERRESVGTHSPCTHEKAAFRCVAKRCDGEKCITARHFRQGLLGWVCDMEQGWRRVGVCDIGCIGKQETTKGTHNKRQLTNEGQQRYTRHKRQFPNQAAVQASKQHTTLTSHRTLCHRGTIQRHCGAAPTTAATGTRTAHIKLK